MASTHSENLHLFEGFPVGMMGTEEIIYGKRGRNSNPN